MPYLSVANFFEYYFCRLTQFSTSKHQKFQLMNIITEFNGCASIQGARVRIQNANSFFIHDWVRIQQQRVVFLFFIQHSKQETQNLVPAKCINSKNWILQLRTSCNLVVSQIRCRAGLKGVPTVLMCSATVCVMQSVLSVSRSVLIWNHSLI